MPENTAIYITDPSMIGSKLFDTIESVESYEGVSEGKNATGFILKLSWGQIKINIMPSDEVVSHLKGFEGYIKSQLDNEDDLIYVLYRLHYIQICLGCVITHDEKHEDDVINFLFDFNYRLNGLLFMYDSVWDWSGEALCGPHKE